MRRKFSLRRRFEIPGVVATVSSGSVVDRAEAEDRVEGCSRGHVVRGEVCGWVLALCVRGRWDEGRG